MNVKIRLYPGGTKAVPRPYHPRSILPLGFCRFYGKYAGGFYPESAKSDAFLPALMQA
jgi:hypothetical protein